MSRSFRELLKFSVPVLLSAALLSGCGSGSSGSADLGQGPSVESPPPPVTVTETFNFTASLCCFQVGTPPIHALFRDGEARGTGAWIIPAGRTASVDFGTPADAVRFSTKDNYTVAAASTSGASKQTFLPSGAQKVDAPFDTAMYVRGSVRGDWAVLPENQLTEVSDNVLAVTMPLAPGDYFFKIADAGWTGETNCGGSENPTPVPLGAAFTLGCSNGSQNLAITIAAAGDYKFTFNATGADKGAPKITVAKDTGGGGGGGGDGGGEPEDSTIIRIYAKDVLAAASQSTLLKTIKGTGSLSVDEVRQGGATRITRIEIENTGAAGAIGVEDFTWTSNPQFAPPSVAVDIHYTRPAASTAGTQITVDGKTYACTPLPTGVGCIARAVSVVPFANTIMSVANADGTKESITFNAFGGQPV